MIALQIERTPRRSPPRVIRDDIKALQHMNPWDWEQFVRTYYSSIYAFCKQILGSSAEAEDATQETFLRAYKKQSTLKEYSAQRAWIYSIARNACFDRKRWWKRQFRLFVRTEDETTEAVATQPQLSELTQELQKAIAELPQKQREVFVLRHWHGFSTEETARLLNLETGTVKSHLKRAVDKLKQRIERIE